MKATDGQREIQRSRQSDGNGLKKKGKHEERELHREIRPQPSEVWTTATKNAKVNIFKNAKVNIFKHAVYTELVTPQCNGLHNRLTDKESLA